MHISGIQWLYVFLGYLNGICLYANVCPSVCTSTILQQYTREQTTGTLELELGWKDQQIFLLWLHCMKGRFFFHHLYAQESFFVCRKTEKEKKILQRWGCCQTKEAFQRTFPSLFPEKERERRARGRERDRLEGSEESEHQGKLIKVCAHIKEL